MFLIGKIIEKRRFRKGMKVLRELSYLRTEEKRLSEEDRSLWLNLPMLSPELQRKSRPRRIKVAYDFLEVRRRIRKCTIRARELGVTNLP